MNITGKQITKEQLLKALMEVVYMQESFCPSHRIHSLASRVWDELSDPVEQWNEDPKDEDALLRPKCEVKNREEEEWLRADGAMEPTLVAVSDVLVNQYFVRDCNGIVNRWPYCRIRVEDGVKRGK